MNKTLASIVIALLCPVFMAASGLKIDEFIDGSRPHHPFYSILFRISNDVHIAINDGYTGFLYHGEDIVEIGLLTANNFNGGRSNIGVVFESQPLLDLGETYTVVVPADACRSVDDPRITNDEIRYTFTVPATIGQPRVEWGPVVTSATSLGFAWSIETDPVGRPKAYLYREDDLVGIYPFACSWDWYMGQGSVNFGKTIYFDKDVEYRIVIPAGSMCAWGRSDLVNEEITVEFTGGWVNVPEVPELRPLGFMTNCHYDWTGKFSWAKFYFDVPVAFSTNKPVMRVFEELDLIAEVTPVVSTDMEYYTVEARFDDIPIKYSTTYLFVIPEGMLHSDDDEMVSNREITGDFWCMSGVEDVRADASGGFMVDGRMLNFEGLRTGSRVSVTAIDGRTVAVATAVSESISLSLPGGGVYIVAIDGAVSKIAVR